MYSIVSIQFWLYFLLFFLTVIVAWYIPGMCFIKPFRIGPIQKSIYALNIGLVAWAMQGFIFGYFSLRWMTYVYLAFFTLWWIYQNRLSHCNFKKLLIDVIQYGKAHWKIIAIMVIGSLCQLTTIWGNSFLTKNGLYFCCGDTTDNTWFASITNQLIGHFPPEQPGMAGTILTNYHYLSNMVVAELSRVFSLPFMHMQYQYCTIFLALLLMFNILLFGSISKMKQTYIFWLAFFLYFGADIIYWLLIVLGRGINFTMSSLEDGSRFYANLPRVYAVVLGVGVINMFLLWRKQTTVTSALLLALLISSLIGFKVYVGIYFAIGIGCVALWMTFAERNFLGWWAVLYVGILSAMVYIPVNVGAGGLYFTGLWRFEDFMVQPALGLKSWELARYIYLDHRNWKHIIRIEITYFIYYCVAIFGTKLFALCQTKQSMRLFPTALHIFFIPGLFVCFIAGAFFMQSVGTSNTFNFLVVVFIYSSFYAALSVDYWLSKISPPFIRGLIIATLILCTIPRITYETTTNIMRLINRVGLMIPYAVLEGSAYIQHTSKKDALVLVDDRVYGYDLNAPMFSILTNRPMFYSGGGLLKHFQVYTPQRETIKKRLFSSGNTFWHAFALQQNNIDYIIMNTNVPFIATESAAYLKPVYQKDTIVVQQVSHDTINQLFPFVKVVLDYNK